MMEVGKRFVVIAYVHIQMLEINMPVVLLCFHYIQMEQIVGMIVNVAAKIVEVQLGTIQVHVWVILLLIVLVN